jgi:hypothetical protein
VGFGLAETCPCVITDADAAWLIRFGWRRIRRRNIVDLFLESSKRFPHPLTDLWKLPGSKNDQNNDKDNDKFRDPHGTKHGVIPFTLVPANRSRSSM